MACLESVEAGNAKMTQNIAVERQKTSRWDLFSHNTSGRVVRAARAGPERSARRVRIARRAARAQ